MICRSCKQDKPTTEFYQRRSHALRPKLRIDARCKACLIAKSKAYAQRNRPKVLAYKKAHWQRVKAGASWRNDAYKRNQNSTKVAYDVQLTAQHGRCAICGRAQADGERRFAFDHDHETGQVRGVLCSACNGGLGCYRDNPELLKAALSYLAYWREQHQGDGTHGLQ